MSWGYGSERMWSAEPISPHGSVFRGRAGVVVEFAPNQFMSWRMRGSFGTVEVDQDVEEVNSFAAAAPLMYIPRFTVIKFDMEGYLDSSDDHAPRPDWATEPTDELEGRRAIGGRP
jgi:hypothetical protein